VRSRFYGVELRDATLPRPQHGHVLLGDFPPILLYQIGERETRILVDVPEGCASAAPAVGGVVNHLRTVVRPVLPPGTQPALDAALAAGSKPRSMPNSWLGASALHRRAPLGLATLGDALNMRHPLTGGGMTVALRDAVLLADLLAPDRVPRLDDVDAVRKQLADFHWRRKSGAAVINILAQALYSLFAADGKC
jgi:squalene monooxygenase